MAASDHLRAEQFPIERVGKMLGQYSGTLEEAYQNGERFGPEEQDYSRLKGYDSAESYQSALKDHIGAHGMKNPIAYQEHPDVPDGLVAHGHHRYFAARDLGWSHVPVEKSYGAVKPVPGWDKHA